MKKTYSHLSVIESDKTLNNILDIVTEGVWDWNAITGQVDRSPGWYKMLSYDIHCFEKDVYTWEDVIHHDDYKMVMKHFEDYITGQIPTYKIKYRCKKGDGSYLWIEDSGKIIEYTNEGKVSRMIGTHKNINQEELNYIKLKEQNEFLLNNNLTLESIIKKRTCELEELNKQLQEKIEQVEYNASFDIVTHIYNRRKFEEIFLKELHRVKRYSHDLSIILIDIDDFKIFNDTCGHKVGDKVLLDLSNLLKGHLRDIDTLARWGGEEFIIILPNTSKDRAQIKAELLRQNIEEKLIVNDITITCSFGVTSYIQGDDTNSIFIRTDKALYLAKDANKNNVKVL